MIGCRPWRYTLIAVDLIVVFAGCDQVFGLHRGPSEAGVPEDVVTTVGVKIVFATRQPLSGAMGGLTGADASCQSEATQASLPGTFKAWLSDDRDSPSTRMTRHPGRYQLTSTHVVAVSWDDLTDGTLAEAIHVTAAGGTTTSIAVCGGLHAGVWSSTSFDGTPTATGTCVNWTSNDSTSYARTGDLLATDANWSAVTNCMVACNTPMQIYCIEQ